jgi:hypothetical protein
VRPTGDGRRPVRVTDTASRVLGPWRSRALEGAQLANSCARPACVLAGCEWEQVVILRPTAERAKILAVSAASSGWVTREQIKLEVQHPKGYSKYLGEFEHQGWVKRRGTRNVLEYRLTPAGRAYWDSTDLPAAAILDKERCEVWIHGRWQIRPVSAV